MMNQKNLSFQVVSSHTIMPQTAFCCAENLNLCTIFFCRRKNFSFFFSLSFALSCLIHPLCIYIMKITCAKHLKDFNQHAGRWLSERKVLSRKIIIIWLLCTDYINLLERERERERRTCVTNNKVWVSESQWLLKDKRTKTKITIPCESVHNGSLAKDCSGKAKDREQDESKNFKVNCKKKSSREKGKGEACLRVRLMSGWRGERERESEPCACIFTHCYMLHHAHIHKNLCFVPNPKFGGKWVRERERKSEKRFNDLCAQWHIPLVHSSDFVYGKCNFRAFLTAHRVMAAVIDAMRRGDGCCCCCWI
jgi:hypothetical protein